MKKHVFISYSRQDTAFVDRLVADLEAQQIPCWIDREGVRYSDTSFEQKIREAISKSFATVLIATPASLDSDYVQGEIDIVNDQEMPLLVVWASGEKFTDTVPSKLTRRSYLDCRGDDYQTGLQQTASELTRLRNEAIPGLSTVPSVDDVPVICISIRIDDETLLAVRPDAYPYLMDLLMDIYNFYLKDRFEAFTYGKTWCLVSQSDFELKLAAVPPEMVWDEKPDPPLYRRPLSEFKMAANSNWEVAALNGAYLFELITDYPFMVELIGKMAKHDRNATASVMKFIALRDMAEEPVLNPNKLQEKFVFYQTAEYVHPRPKRVVISID